MVAALPRRKGGLSPPGGSSESTEGLSQSLGSRHLCCGGCSLPTHLARVEAAWERDCNHHSSLAENIDADSLAYSFDYKIVFNK